MEHFYFVTCGAVIGDISGSTLENKFIKEKPACLIPPRSQFTDDTVLTCAVAAALQAALPGLSPEEIVSSASARSAVSRALTEEVVKYARAYPHAGYGGNFRLWMQLDEHAPYGSYGNGAPMRCSYAGWAARTLEEAEELGRLTAAITHDHPDAMTAAAVVSGCIYMLRTGASKQDILAYASGYYNLCFSLDALRPIHAFNITASGTVPVAIAAFLESESFADTIALADSMGGDVDTLAAIAGSIAEAAYSIPEELLAQAEEKLDKALLEDFRKIQENWLARGNSLPVRPAALPSLKPEPRKINDQE